MLSRHELACRVIALTVALATLCGPEPLAAQTRDPVIDAQSLFDARQPASAAAAMLTRDHRRTLDQSATVLRTVGYSARTLVPALRTEFTQSLSAVYGSLRQAGFAPREIADAFAGNGILLDCIDPQGFPVPCGNFGGQHDNAAMGQVSWSPKPQGQTNGQLHITASNMPPVSVRLGSLTLTQLSATSSSVVVRLPATPMTGALQLVRTSDNVVGPLQNDYSVVSPPLPWMNYATVAAAGAIADMKRWMSGARITSGCVVNGPLATVPIGHFTSSSGFNQEVRSRLLAVGASAAVADAWDTAFRSAFSAYAANVTVPSLPFYPALLAVSAPTAAPVTNVPTPLALLVSVGAVSMQMQTLAPAISAAISPVSPDDPARAEAVGAFTAIVSAKFTSMLAHALVVQLKGGGPVPKYNPPGMPAAPVEGGSCSGSNIVLVPPNVW